MLVLLLVHFTFLLNAFDGDIVVFNVIVFVFNTDVLPVIFIVFTGVHSTYLQLLFCANVLAAVPAYP